MITPSSPALSVVTFQLPMFRGVAKEMTLERDWAAHLHSGLPMTQHFHIARTYAKDSALGKVWHLSLDPGALFLKSAWWPDSSSFSQLEHRLGQLIERARRDGLAGVMVPEHLEGTLGHHCIEREAILAATEIWPLLPDNWPQASAEPGIPIR